LSIKVLNSSSTEVSSGTLVRSDIYTYKPSLAVAFTSSSCGTVPTDPGAACILCNQHYMHVVILCTGRAP
jgi:hypothetical protein